MKSGLNMVVIFLSMWLLTGCGQEEDSLSTEVQMQQSLDRINELLEKSKKGDAPVFQDVKRLKQIKANLEKELSKRRARQATQ